MNTGQKLKSQIVGILKTTIGVAVILVPIALAVGTHSARTPAIAATTKDAALRTGIAAYDSNDFNLAFKKFSQSAKSNNPKAAYWLGRMYEGGLGVKKDMHAALDWYRKSAQAGLVQAKMKLGEIYYRGTEELQDFSKARKWLEDAANNGSARAQRELGVLYAHGWGVKKSPVWAYVWYEIATREGDFIAQQLRDRLLKSMPDDQIAEAQKLSQKVAPEISGRGSTQPKNARGSGKPG